MLRLLTSSDFVDILNCNKTYNTIASTTPVLINKLFSTYNKVEVMIQKVYYSEYPGELLFGQQILLSNYYRLLAKIKASVWEVWCTSFFLCVLVIQSIYFMYKIKACYSSRLSDCLLYCSIGKQYRRKTFV